MVSVCTNYNGTTTKVIMKHISKFSLTRNRMKRYTGKRIYESGGRHTGTQGSLLSNSLDRLFF